MTVRSLVLVKRNLTVAQTYTLAVCPAGFTLLIKDIRLYQAGNATLETYLSVNNGATGEGVNIFTDALAQYVPVGHAVWLVLEPGDYLSISLEFAPVEVWVSGSLLSGVASGYTPPAG